MLCWTVFPSPLRREAARPRQGTWCKMKWSHAWTPGGKLSACDSLDERAAFKTLHPPQHTRRPPFAQETKHAFMCLTDGGGSFSRLINSASWRCSCWDQSQRQPATRSQLRRMTRTRVVRLADSAVASSQMATRYIYLWFFPVTNAGLACRFLERRFLWYYWCSYTSLKWCLGAF